MEYSRIIPDKGRPSAAALGLFDGVHLGHRAVLKEAAACGPALRPTVFTFTFDIPEQITKPHFANICTHSHRMKLFEELGIEAVFEPPFSSFRSLSPEEFFRDILVKKLGARAIFCGEDFRFGKKAAGDAALLRSLCEKEGIRFCAVKPLLEGGEPISSTRIRGLLREGKMQEARQLLGTPYTIDYPVAHGRQLGRTMGYPTINQLYEPGDLLPKAGVYATTAQIDEKIYFGVTNIGVKPTLGGTDAPSAETTLLGFSGDLYGRQVPVKFYAYLRPEKKFDSIEELFRQIAADADKARSVLPGLISGNF